MCIRDRYNLKKELQQEEIDAIDSLAGALVEALRNRYEEQRKAEQDRIQESLSLIHISASLLRPYLLGSHRPG